MKIYPGNGITLHFYSIFNFNEKFSIKPHEENRDSCLYDLVNEIMDRSIVAIPFACNDMKRMK